MIGLVLIIAVVVLGFLAVKSIQENGWQNTKAMLTAFVATIVGGFKQIWDAVASLFGAM